MMYSHIHEFNSSYFHTVDINKIWFGLHFILLKTFFEHALHYNLYIVNLVLHSYRILKLVANSLWAVICVYVALRLSLIQRTNHVWSYLTTIKRYWVLMIISHKATWEKLRFNSTKILRIFLVGDGETLVWTFNWCKCLNWYK